MPKWTAFLLLSLYASILVTPNCASKNNERAPKKLQSKSQVNTPTLVSFAPSCTELLEAIKAQDSLIGVCKFCDLPSSLNLKIERVGDFNSANIERLTRLKPNMVLTVSGQDALIHSLKSNKLEVVTFDNNRLSSISANLQSLGRLTHHEKQATAEAQKFDNAIAELKTICQKAKTHPTVFMCVWPQPLLTAGNSSFLNDALVVCGGKNIAGDLASPYPHFSLERLILNDPEVVIMPYEAKSTDYVNRAPWSTLRAFKSHRIYFLDKTESDRLSRPSTHVLTGLFWLAKNLHPECTVALKTWLEKTELE